jgi:sortase (surface protein transpeptidase)
VLLVAVVVLAAGVAVWDAARTPAAADVTAASAGDPGAWFEHDAPDPVAVRSEVVDIESPTIPLGKTDDGRLEVPEDAHTAGWWTGRANPGERGPAVIVGHVDSREGPGAFWELGDLEVGDRVTVDREDGTSVHFRVERLETHPKDDFPTEAVYGDTPDPTLRLVTCSGHFDPENRSYEDNTIVFLALDEEQDVVPDVASSSEVEARNVDHSADGDAADLDGDAADADDAPGAGATTRAPGGAGDARSEPGPRRDLAMSAGSGESPDRSLPIAVATLTLVAAGGAVLRELRGGR